LRLRCRALALELLQAEDKAVNEENIGRFSPAHYKHISLFGKYRFEVEEGLNRNPLASAPQAF
jgi:hypothetical protein